MPIMAELQVEVQQQCLALLLARDRRGQVAG
jgi:hypothetical protein